MGSIWAVIQVTDTVDGLLNCEDMDKPRIIEPPEVFRKRCDYCKCLYEYTFDMLEEVWFNSYRNGRRRRWTITCPCCKNAFYHDVN